MVEADKRHHRRFPFFVVFLIALIVGCEYFFGTMQIQSSLRGGSSHDYTEDSHAVDKMVNETIEILLSRLQDRSGSDERLVLLEKQLSSLEAAFRAHVTAGDESESERKTIDKTTRDAEEVNQETSDPHESNEPFCVTWETNTDDWWTHHPDWYVSDENMTHYCYSPMEMEDPKKAAVMRKLYDVQFKTGDCSNVTTKQMWSSGWGADFENVVDGLLHAYRSGTPTQMYVKEGAWHYAGKKDASRPVCESKDMYCYFLNMTRCPANPERPYEGSFMAEDFEMHRGIGRWLLEFATRQQTWLRREVYRFSRKTDIKTPCTVMHVRRTDIVLHDEWARKYRKIEEYVSALDNSTKNILLLTDDQNAIEEAKTLHPDYNWMFIDRPRHRGAEGGWENQIPSDDPKLEVIVLLTIFRLVRQCSSFIHTHSNFARVIQGEMKDALKGQQYRRVDLDANDPNIFNANNSLSVNLSLPFA